MGVSERAGILGREPNNLGLEEPEELIIRLPLHVANVSLLLATYQPRRLLNRQQYIAIAVPASHRFETAARKTDLPSVEKTPYEGFRQAMQGFIDEKGISLALNPGYVCTGRTVDYYPDKDYPEDRSRGEFRDTRRVVFSAEIKDEKTKKAMEALGYVFSPSQDVKTQTLDSFRRPIILQAILHNSQKKKHRVPFNEEFVNPYFPKLSRYLRENPWEYTE